MSAIIELSLSKEMCYSIMILRRGMTCNKVSPFTDLSKQHMIGCATCFTHLSVLLYHSTVAVFRALVT